MSKKKKKIRTGGVALFDGIMFMSEYRQVVVEQKDSRIVGSSEEVTIQKNIIDYIPIIRGIVALTSQINEAAGEISKDDDEIPNYVARIADVILILVCIGVPVLISAFFDKSYQNIVQFVGIFLEVFAYMMLLKFSKSMKVLFMYHGAEHKAVNAYDKCKNTDELTLENIKKASRIHKRCGGNLVMYVIFFMFLSVFFNIDNLMLKYIAMVSFSIFSVGVSWEIINIFSKIPSPLDIINYPACIIQLITTKEPTEEMLILAREGIIASTREKDRTIAEFVNECKKEKNIENIQDLYAIIEAVTCYSRDKIMQNKDNYTIGFKQELDAKYMLQRYLDDNYPLQYLTHKQFFYNEEYYVDENVLIPRADTEILVEKAIEYIKSENIEKIIDLCCGSGAIGISISKNVEKDIDVELIDISQGALKVSNKNIKKNNAINVHILQSDLLKEKITQIEKDENLKVDMIVSNPPYVKTEDMKSLDENVKKEPRIALDGGKDGMKFYTQILKEANKVLKPNGLLLFEIGYDELSQIEELIKENNEFKLLESVKDYGGNDRVVICRFQPKLEEKY